MELEDVYDTIIRYVNIEEVVEVELIMITVLLLNLFINMGIYMVIEEHLKE